MWRRQLLDPHGESPLRAMEVTGTTKRVRTPRMGFVLEMLEDSPPAKLLMPKSSLPRLNLRHRYLLIEVRTDPFKKFSIEIGVKDAFQLSRTLTLSAGCKAPELARGGGAKAKLPLLSVAPPGVDSDVARREGWRLAVLDLDYLVRRAFDGAPYAKLESVALVGVCHALSITASAELPQVAPPGPVRLMAGFNEDEIVPPLPPPPPPPPPNPADPDDLAKRVAAARDAEQYYLKAHLAKAPPVSEEAVGFVPGGYDVPDVPGAEPSAMPGRLKAAVRRLQLANRFGGARIPGGATRRYGDPRDHLTTRQMVHAGGEHDDAAVFKREQQLPGDVGKISDDKAVVRVAFAEAQELARRLRWGNAGEIADLSNKPIGEGGARLLSFVLPKGRGMRELRFNGAGIGDGGAAYMATALRQMTSARHVDLRWNQIGPKGASQLADALEAGCIGVTCLLLGNNDLGPSGVAAFAAALPSHRSIHRLDVAHTACGHGLRPLFRDGDTISLDGKYVVHARTGRRIPRADTAGGGQGGGPSQLRGMGGSERLGQMIDMRTLARPPLSGAVSNCGSNAAIEALVVCLGTALPTLRHLHLGGNFGGLSRTELKQVAASGPNGLAPKGVLAITLDAADDAAADAAVAAAALAEAERRALLAVAKPVDEEVALTESAKQWMSGSIVKAGNVPIPPAPSLMSQASFTAWGGLELGDDDDDDDDDEALVEETGGDAMSFKGLMRSQTMSSMQKSTFALVGGRFDAQSAPLASAEGDGY